MKPGDCFSHLSVISAGDSAAVRTSGVSVLARCPQGERRTVKSWRTVFRVGFTYFSSSLFLCCFDSHGLLEVFSNVLLSSVLFNIVVAHTIPLHLLSKPFCPSWRSITLFLRAPGLSDSQS